MTPEVPAPYELALLALAAFRVWKLIADDEILNVPRNWLLKKLGTTGSTRGAHWWLFLTCPWCAGFWVALAWWGAWLASPGWAVFAAVPLAVSAGVGLLARLLPE